MNFLFRSTAAVFQFRFWIRRQTPRWLAVQPEGIGLGDGNHENGTPIAFNFHRKFSLRGCNLIFSHFGLCANFRANTALSSGVAEMGAWGPMTKHISKKSRYFRLLPNLAQRKLIYLANHRPSFMPYEAVVLPLEFWELAVCSMRRVTHVGTRTLRVSPRQRNSFAFFP